MQNNNWRTNVAAVLGGLGLAAVAYSLQSDMSWAGEVGAVGAALGAIAIGWGFKQAADAKGKK